MMHGAQRIKTMGHGFATRITTLAVLGGLIIAPMVWAQSIETGAVVGSVTDEQGATLPGTTVVLSSPTQGTSKTLIVDQNGIRLLPWVGDAKSLVCPLLLRVSCRVCSRKPVVSLVCPR